MYSFDFELPGEPAQLAPFRNMKPQIERTTTIFDPNSFTENATDDSAPCSAGATFGCYDPALLGTLGNARARSAADRTSATRISRS